MRRMVESPSVVRNIEKGDGRRARRGQRLRGATALATGLFALGMLATPAAAQETSGGNGAGPTGGTGGASSAGGIAGNGGNGGAGGDGGGGGGGAGPSGSAGGSGETNGGTVPGAAGGLGPGGNGGDGTSNLYSGSGGGGGAHGYVGTALPANAAAGGSGGVGGSGNYGGGGGAGGYGAVIADGGDLGTLMVGITGGNGGIGGAGSIVSGFGGQGGHGLVLTAPSTLSIDANVSGGNGGSVFSGSVPGLGGYGIVGSDLTITINAAVSGGFEGTGTNRAYALFLTGGNNSLTGGAGNSILGGINLAAGTLTLDGTNNITGGITVNGTLRLLSNGAAGGAGNTITTTGSVISYADGVDNATPIVLNSNDTQLEVLNADIATQSGAISETGGARPLEKIGTGTLILSGSNSFSGGLRVSAGLINFANDANLGTGNITLDGGGLQWATGNTLDISGRLNAIGVGGGTFDTNGNDVAFATALTGFGGITKTGEGMLTLAGSDAYDGLTTISGGTLVATSLGFNPALAMSNGSRLEFGAGLSLSTLTLTNGGGTIALDNFGNVSGSFQAVGGGLTKAGTGTIALSGGGYVNGAALQVDQGLLDFASPITFDEGSLLTFNGGLVRSGVSQLWDGFLSIRWTENASNSSLSVVPNQTLTIYSSISLEGGTNGNPTLRFGTSSDTGTIVLNSAVNFTADGTGALVVDGGTLSTDFGNDVLNVLASGLGSVQINAPGILDLSGGAAFTDSQAIRSLTGSGELINDSTTRILAGDFSGDISGAGGIEKTGGGTLFLTGSNSYTGTTSILGGTLGVNATGLGLTQLVEIGNGATLQALTGFGMGAVSILDGGGTIDTNGAGRIVSISGDIDYGGQLTLMGGGLLFIDDVLGTGSGGINVLSGTLALGGDFAAGEGTVILADGTRLENAAFGCGCDSLVLANNIVVDGTATIDGFGRYTALDGQLSGGNFRFVNGSQNVEGPGALATFELTGANSYGDTFIGANVQLALTGTGTLGAGDVTFDTTPSNPLLPFVPGLIFANDEDYEFEGRIIGNGFVIVDTFFNPEATITLSGSNTTGNNFTGTIEVLTGRLNIEGNFGDVDNRTASLIVDACGCAPEDASFGGSGTFHGNVEILNGTLAPGNSPGTLNIAGNLTLGAGTILNFEFGQPGVVGNNVNDFVTVGGTLTLDGTLNVLDFGPSYGPGYYALFRYGTLVDNGLTIGTVAGGLSTQLLFNIPGQVNLRLGDQVVQYWDGTDVTGATPTVGGEGGSTIWNTANTNWTAASGFGVNDQWRSTVGVFAGATGSVSVQGVQSFQELRFETDGYFLTAAIGGGQLSTTGGFSVIQVNPSLNATINLDITGAGGLTKTGTGTLFLTQPNSYAGLTTVSAGTLHVTNSGSLAGDVTVDSGATFQNDGTVAGTLQNTGTAINSFGTIGEFVNNSGTFTTTGIVNPLISGLALTNNASGTVNAEGQINGLIQNSGIFNVTGALTGITRFNQFGTASLNLQSNNFSVGGLGGAGTVNLGSATLTVGVGNLNSTYGGVISGSGGLTKVGTDIFTLSGANTYTGTTTVSAGTLRVAGAGIIAGPVLNNATLENFAVINGNVTNNATYTQVGTLNGIFINNGNASIRGQLNNNVVNGATGNITLTGNTTGIVRVAQVSGALFDLAGFNTTFGSLSGNGEVRLGAAQLTVGGDNTDSTFAGIVTGSGAGNGLTKVGTGTLILSGANTYTGLTTVSGGVLEIASTGSLAGNVQNNATFTNLGIVNGNLTNTGTVNARGQINGTVNNSGTFNVTGGLTGITTFTQTAAGLLDLGQFSLTLGALEGAGTVNLRVGTPTLTVGGSNTNFQFAGTITGPGNLTKVGTGTFTLSGTNNFSGTTQVNAGTLEIAATGSLASNVINGATLQNAGTISGGATNNGTAVNSGEMTGGTTNNGTFTSTGRIAGSFENNATAFLQNRVETDVNNRAGIITLTGNTTGIGRVNQSAGALFDLAGFNTTFGSLSGSGEVRAGTAQLTVGSDNTDSTFAGIITGSGANGLTKVGTGTLTLSGANSYAGTTTVTGGVLQVGTGGTTGTLGGGDMIVNGTLRFNRSNIVTIDDLITGSGVVENAGTGTLTLTRNSTVGAAFTGRVDILNGALALNAVFGDLTANSAQLTVSSGASISGGGIFHGSATINGTLSPGNSPGTLTFAGNLTLGSGAILNYELGVPGTVGGASNDLVVVGGNLTIDGTLNVAAFGPDYAAGYYRLFNYGGSLTDNGIASGTIANGLSATVLTNIAGQVNVRLGPQVIQYWDGTDTTGAGTAANGDGGAGTWGSGTNWTAATGFAINDSWRASTGVFGGAAGGNVTVVGTQSFQELRFVTDGYELTAATAADGLATTAGFSLINVSAPQAVIAAPISGAAGLTKTGAGTLILAGANTYTGGTTISAGTLQLGNGGATGSVVGDIQNNAILSINRNNPLTLAGVISGTGQLVQAGTGTTTLTGANTYTGGTLIQAGRLRGDVVSLRGDIQDNATLEFAQATAGTFTGRLLGAGVVESTGAGLLTFTTDNSNLTGDTRVLAGELRVNGLLSRSRVVVGNTAALSGTGTVGGILAQSGGTVAPGAGGFGTLSVNGNMQFLAGSTFAVQVQPAGSDLVTGTGTAQLAGTIAVANAGGTYSFGAVYVLLQANGGRTGTFDAATGLNTFGAAFAPQIVYTPTQVQLVLTQNQLLNIVGPDGTPNQRSTLTRIDAAVTAGYNPQPLLPLYGLTPRSALLNGADQLSGEIYATSVRAALDEERLVREATFGRLRLTQDMGFDQGFGGWGHAVGAWGSGDTDGNAARYQRDQQGFVVGLDGGGTFNGGSWRVGLLGHHLSTDVRVDARGSNAEIERAGGGVYAGLDFGGLRLRAGGIYSSLDLEGTRVAAFTGFAETLTGETDGEALQGFAEIAYRFQVGASTHVEPYFQAAYARVEFDAFSETGGASRLRVAAEEDDLTTLAFGLRAGTVMPIGGNTNLRLDGGLGGRHLSGDRMIFSLISLDASPNQAFDIRSAAMDRFAVTGNVDATFEFGSAVTLSIGYSGVFAGNARDHAARATLGMRF